MTPAFKIMVDGIDSTARVNDRLVSLTVVDNDGSKSDEFTLVIDDRDFALAVPRKGATVVIFLGYLETGLAMMGQFKVNRVQRRFDKGSGATMEVTGKSADLKEEMKSQRHGKYVDKTMQQIVSEVAGRHGMGAQVSPKLGQLKRTPEYQSEESDLHFLTRMAQDHDAVFKVANGQFLFLSRDEISGGAIVLAKGDFTECTVETDDRAEHKTARGHYYDRGEQKRKKVEQEGGEGGQFTMRHTFQDEAVAKDCARAKKRQLERQAKTLSGTGPGNTAIMAGLMLQTVIGAELYDGTWRIKTATHTYTKSAGYSTALEAGTEDKGGSGGGGSAGS